MKERCFRLCTLQYYTESLEWADTTVAGIAALTTTQLSIQAHTCARSHTMVCINATWNACMSSCNNIICSQVDNTFTESVFMKVYITHTFIPLRLPNTSTPTLVSSPDPSTQRKGLGARDYSHSSWSFTTLSYACTQVQIHDY